MKDFDQEAVFGSPHDDDRINDLNNWRDEQGVTHIQVFDLNITYALCDDGKFRELVEAPF